MSNGRFPSYITAYALRMALQEGMESMSNGCFPSHLWCMRSHVPRVPLQEGMESLSDGRTPHVDAPFCGTRVALQEGMENAGFEHPSRRGALLCFQSGSTGG